MSFHGPDATVIRCRGCGGETSNTPGKLAVGWYSLSVAVPEHFTTKTGRPYVWAGLFCSVQCIEDSIPGLRRQESLAHQGYEPVRPRFPAGQGPDRRHS